MTYANRGMALEMLIGVTNQNYRNKGIALIDKLPTPIKVIKAQGSRINHAVFEAKSTVDYYGIYQGRPITFEAKSTKEKTSFPLSNFHEHQVNHIRACLKQGAVCFVILEFSKYNQIFYVPGKVITDAWDAATAGGRKSIPYEDIERTCYLIKSTNGVPCDYLAVVDELITQKETVQ